MSHRTWTALRGALVAGIACLLAVPVGAQQPDLTGLWRLTTTVQLETVEGQLPCVFEGSTKIVQNGTELTGLADLQLLSGPDACPAEMNGDLSGFVETGGNGIGTFVAGNISGPLGLAFFQGQLSSANEAAGSMAVEQGDFAGQGGTWSAGLLGSLDIPTLTPLGLTVLILGLLAVGALLLRRARLNPSP